MPSRHVLIAAAFAAALSTAVPAAATPATRSYPAVSAERLRQLWRQYDTDRNGYLTPLEFAMLAYALRGHPIPPGQVLSTARSRRPNALAVRIMNETAIDFTSADANRDERLSLAELEAFLAARAGG